MHIIYARAQLQEGRVQILFCFISAGPGGSSAVGGYMCPPPASHLGFPRQQGHPVPQAQPHFDTSTPHYWRRGMCICHEGKTLLSYRILPKISLPPLFNSRHGPDWVGVLFLNMHKAPRI